jgi:8-oxo-dGTP pyrophosphatase MutT (NUDIX family)
MIDGRFPKETLYNIGVKAVILNKDKQILLLNITRKNSTETYWDLPGGRIADGETQEDTLRREVEEETGITELSIERHLTMVTSRVRLPIFDDKKVGVIFSVYVCLSGSKTEQPEERITMHWCSKSEAVANLKSNPDWPAEVIDRIAEI